MTSSSFGTRWFQAQAWMPASKLEGSHQQGPQEIGIGWDEVQEAAVCRGQEELVESCLPTRL